MIYKLKKKNSKNIAAKENKPAKQLQKQKGCPEEPVKQNKKAKQNPQQNRQKQNPQNNSKNNNKQENKSVPKNQLHEDVERKNSGWNKRRHNKPNAKNNPPVKIIPLGGIGEIGKNMTLFEYEDEIIIVDCGMAFPDDDMLGIDLVIPDFTYVNENEE